MLKYEFFNPAIQGLKPADAARVTKALEAAVLYGRIEYAQSKGLVSVAPSVKRYREIISDLNGRAVFGD